MISENRIMADKNAPEEVEDVRWNTLMLGYVYAVIRARDNKAAIIKTL